MLNHHHKIFVSDLDGTLLGAGGRLSAYSRDALCRLLAEGVQFTVASARAWGEITPVLGDLPLSLPVIAINGAYITDYATGEHLVMNNIEDGLSRAIYQHVLDEGLRPFVVTYNGVEDCLYWDQLTNAEMQWYHDILVVEKDKRIRQADDLCGVLDEKVIAFAVMGPKERVTAVWELLAAEYPGQLENFLFENPYSPGHWWLTIHDQRSCKSKAVAKLVEMTGHDLKDLTTFGDHINDIKMLQMAGTGVAMGNAEEEVKVCADVVIGSNEQDAVVKYVKEILKIK
jgi:Cof subfamily protein (haloacid dehalogenase superfamily)